MATVKFTIEIECDENVTCRVANELVHLARMVRDGKSGCSSWPNDDAARVINTIGNRVALEIP